MSAAHIQVTFPRTRVLASFSRKFVRIACAFAALVLSGCGGDADLDAEGPDGSFGRPAEPAHDAGLDGGSIAADGATSNVPLVRVRFVHAIPNLGALVLCHDPDGPGPVAAALLHEGSQLLRADYGTRSDAVLVPALQAGELTLQRDVARDLNDAGTDGGVSQDGGIAFDPCDPSSREATIPLPITGEWLAPSAPVSDDQLENLDLLPTLSGVGAITLFGTGAALNANTLADRAEARRQAYVATHEADATSADAGAMAAALERDTLTAAFGPRALIQPDLTGDRADAFTLAVFHAVPDVPTSGTSAAEREVGAIRLCVTAGSRNSGVLPKAPLAGVPFRVRTRMGDDFTPGLTYDFRVYAQAAFDDTNQDCATTSLSPLAKATFQNLLGGHAYTLAFYGAVSPVALCSANDVSLIRASCSRPASELGARLDLLAD